MNRYISSGIRLALLLAFSPAGFGSELHGPMKGLFWMAGSAERQGEESVLKDMDETLSSNEFLSGVSFGVSWKQIEPQPGQFVWTAIDAQIERARKYRKMYKFIIHFGVETPAWLYQQGVPSFASIISNPRRANHGEEVLIPIPWDEKYLQLLDRLLGKIAERYGSDPYLVAVSLAGANFMSGEMHLPKREEDLTKWAAYGDFRAKIETAYHRLIDLYAIRFPQQQICLHISMPLPGMDSQVESIVEYGVSKYPLQFTLQSCQLNGRNDNSDIFSYALVRKFQERAPHGFQNVAGWAHDDTRQGSMEMATYNMVRAKAEYWELWRGDGMSRDLCARLMTIWKEAQALGADAYAEKLKTEGKFREVTDSRKRDLGE